MDGKILADRVHALHGSWWEALWMELAADENGLTAEGCWDSFEEEGKRLLAEAALDLGSLVEEFEVAGDPHGTPEEKYSEMARKATTPQ